MRRGVRPACFTSCSGSTWPIPAPRVAEARTRIDAAAREPDSDAIRFSLAPHAPYSVSPALFDALRRDASTHGDVTTVHLAESREEVQLLADGTGPWRGLLDTLGVWTDAWQPPACSPVAYLQQRGFLDASTLIVHGVQCTGDDIARVRATGATLVVLSAQQRLRRGRHFRRLPAFYAAGVPVAFGTDSLASVEDLNLFSELARARRLAPGVPARRLIESATAVGARALGFGGEYGTIEPGKRAALISVRVPGDVRDVEEYLVSGITAADVAWVFTPPHDPTGDLPVVRPLQPFGLRAAVRADRRAAGVAHGAVLMGAGGLDRPLHGERPQRGDGLQPRRGRPLRRAQPADRHARASARRHDACARPRCSC